VHVTAEVKAKQNGKSVVRVHPARPVLIGVAVLSGATASFPAALAVGLTNVAGMVAPLAILAIVWDRKD